MTSAYVHLIIDVHYIYQLFGEVSHLPLSSTCRKSGTGPLALVRKTKASLIKLVPNTPSGMLDWDNTNIVFTKRSLIEFLKFVFLSANASNSDDDSDRYTGTTVDTNFSNISKLPRKV